MNAEIEFIASGGVTSPRGFHAGATYAGIKKKAKDSLDLGILFSEVPSVATALFTTNRIKAAPIVWCQQQLKSSRAAAVVVNSGCANACTGEQGLADVTEIAELTAKNMGLFPKDVLVASTGVIGYPLPMKLVRAGLDQIVLSAGGGHQLAKAMMTTDTVSKETAIAVRTGEVEFIIGGVAKGSGMMHPELATLLCFLTTDAAVDVDFLKSALQRAVDISFNLVSIDSDTSTNDMVLIMANGLAGNKPILVDSQLADVFQQALDQVCVYLAKCLARDGEGASKRILSSSEVSFSLNLNLGSGLATAWGCDLSEEYVTINSEYMT